MDNNHDSIRSAVLEAAEAVLHAQLSAIQRLRSNGAPGTVGSVSTKGSTLRTKGRSQISMTYDILKDANRPLHVSEIISGIATRFGASVDRESLVSAISKRVVRGDVFTRTDKNTFWLIESTQTQKELPQ